MLFLAPILLSVYLCQTCPVIGIEVSVYSLHSAHVHIWYEEKQT